MDGFRAHGDSQHLMFVCTPVIQHLPELRCLGLRRDELPFDIQEVVFRFGDISFFHHPLAVFGRFPTYLGAAGEVEE